jgi:hypothetical protein
MASAKCLAIPNGGFLFNAKSCPAYQPIIPVSTK